MFLANIQKVLLWLKCRYEDAAPLGGRHDMPRPSPLPVGAEAPCAAVAAVSHGQHVPTPTAAA